MIELLQLKQLVSIADCGTLSLASQILALSQPALTRSVQRLEEAVGARLFDRTKNSMTLNENGMLAVDYARRILSLSEEMRESVLALEKSRCVIKIGSVAPAPLWILEPKLRAEFPGKKIETCLMDEEELVRSLLDKKLSCIVMPCGAENLPRKDVFVSKKLCEENLFFSLPKNHRLAAKKDGLHFADMDGETFIVHSEIGFWDKIHRANLPASKFILQSDNAMLEELIVNSTLPHFVTDLSLKHLNRPVADKQVVPILDEAAHVRYFLWERADSPLGEK